MNAIDTGTSIDANIYNLFIVDEDLGMESFLRQPDARAVSKGMAERCVPPGGDCNESHMLCCSNICNRNTKCN